MKYKIYYRLRKETLYMELSIPPEREVLISTGIKVSEKYWDEEKKEIKKTFNNAERANLNLKTQRNNLEDILLTAQFEKKRLTAKQVKELFTTKPLNNIFRFVEQYINDYSNKRSSSTLENYRKHLKKLEDFHGNKNLNFEDITSDFLRRYEEFIFNSNVEKKLSVNYASVLMRTLKQMFFAAAKRKIIDTNPFVEYERPKYQAPKKEFLTLKELITVENHISETDNMSHKITAIYFLFGCYTGLRVSDWYNFDQQKHIHNNFIELEAEKNKKPVNVPISNPLERILLLMQEIPLKLAEQTINEKLKEIMKKLKIDKKITTHCGRHTFAVTMCLSLSVSSETAAKIMGITLQTFVDNYSQVTQHKITAETSRAWQQLI